MIIPSQRNTFFIITLFVGMHSLQIFAFTIPSIIPILAPSSNRNIDTSASISTSISVEVHTRKHSQSVHSTTVSLARDEHYGERKGVSYDYGYREAPMPVNQTPSPAERELSQMNYQEEEREDQNQYDDQDYGYAYEYEYDDEGDYDQDYPPRRGNRRSVDAVKQNENAGSGNFWSNPLGGVDDVDRDRDRDREQGSRRSRSSPREIRPRSNTNLPRERGSSRKTFRSGNPPPPAVLKDFYDRLFWYGFDSDETTSAADKTMFGGTKGKFRGLDLLQDGKREILESGRVRKKVEYEDDYDDEYKYNRYKDDDEYEDDIIYYDDEYYDEDELWDDEDEYDDDDLAAEKKTRSMIKDKNLPEQNTQSLPSRNEYNDIGEDYIYEPRFSNEKSDQRTPLNSRPRRGPERRGARPNRRGSSQRKRSVASSWFEDDDYDEEEIDGGRRDGKPQTSPIINILDKVFQVDPDEVKFQADDYNRRLGLNKKKGARQTWKEQRSASKPRKGYAYRYEDDVKSNSAVTDSGEFDDETIDSESDDDVIDVEAQVQPLSLQNGKVSESRKLKEQSWEDRASAYDRVPPKGIKAWGPEGEINGGIDARTYAAQCAMEEIDKMKKIFEKKEALVKEAESDLLQLKREASNQKQKLLSEDDRRNSPLIRDQLRKINFGIEDSARILRKAKAEALSAIDKLESIEFRHWALLRQHEAEGTFSKRSSPSAQK